jgi:hypothetical protein
MLVPEAYFASNIDSSADKQNRLWNEVLEKLIVAQPLEKFSGFGRTQKSLHC